MGGKVEEDGLTPLRRSFCEHYVANNLNGAKAARLAGFPANSARQEAYRLLTNAYVKEYINELLQHAVMPKNEVLARISMQGRGTLADVMNENLTDIDLKRAEEDGSIGLIKKLTKKPDGTFTVEMYSAQDARDQLAKYHDLFGNDDDWRKALTGLGEDASTLFRAVVSDIKSSAAESPHEDDV